jgi:hypothetical protein
VHLCGIFKKLKMHGLEIVSQLSQDYHRIVGRTPLLHKLIECVVDTCMQRVNNSGIQRCWTKTETERRRKKKGDKRYID